MQGIADRQAALLRQAQHLQHRRINLRIGLAVIAHGAAQSFVAPGDGTGTFLLLAGHDHRHVGIGANHRQAARRRCHQQRLVRRRRTVIVARARVKEELRLGGVGNEVVVQTVADGDIALAADMQAAPPEPGIEGIRPFV